MPIYQYKVKGKMKGCEYCQKGFEVLQPINAPSLRNCPVCGGEIEKIMSPFSMGFSKSGLDSKAKEKGFHKLKKVDKGKYEKLY